VIVHSTVSEQRLSVSQLRRIYSMRQVKWSNNQPIVVFVLPSQSALHQSFCKDTLKLFPYQLDRVWDKLTFSGLGVAPTEVSNVEALVRAVKNTPGSIGYVGRLLKDEEVNIINVYK